MTSIPDTTGGAVSLLDRPDGTGTPGQDPGRLGRELDRFLAAHPGSVIGATGIMNPLLDLWETVHAQDPAAARPIERLLTGLVCRHCSTSAELGRMADAVRDTLRADADRGPWEPLVEVGLPWGRFT